jgi:hypothetical protein
LVAKSSILTGTGAENLAQEFLDNNLISNWQKLAPAHVNTARILIIVAGGDDDYDNALSAVIAGAELGNVLWQHEDYLTYGNPNDNTWMPLLASPPRYVSR